MIVAFAVAQIPLIGQSRLTAQVMNGLHVLYFGLLAVLLIVPLRRAAWLHGRSRWVTYFAAAAAAGIFAALIEGAQFFGPRDADFADWLRGCAGIVGFLGIWLGIGGDDIHCTPVIARLRIALVAASIIGLLAALLPVADAVSAYIGRARAYPTLASFDRSWTTYFIRLRNAALRSAPGPDTGRAGEPVSRIEFSGELYSGIEFIEPYPDWSEFSRLRFVAVVPGPSAQILKLRIEDGEHDFSYADRFNRELRLEPGRNDVIVPLDDVREAPATRAMDLTRIRRIVIFTPRPVMPFEVYLSAIWLE